MKFTSIVTALAVFSLNASAVSIGGGMTPGPGNYFDIKFVLNNDVSSTSNVASLSLNAGTCFAGSIFWDNVGGIVNPPGATSAMEGIYTKNLTFTFADAADGFNPGEVFSLQYVDRYFVDGPHSIMIGQLAGTQATFTFKDMSTWIGEFVDDPNPDAGLMLVPCRSYISGFTLWDADANLPNGGPVTEGSVLCKLNNEFAIEAKVHECGASVGTIKSVVLSTSGPINYNQKENFAPYMSFGNRVADAYGLDYTIGSYTLKATAYTEKRGKGSVVDEVTIHFSVTSCGRRLRQ